MGRGGGSRGRRKPGECSKPDSRFGVQVLGFPSPRQPACPLHEQRDPPHTHTRSNSTASAGAVLVMWVCAGGEWREGLTCILPLSSSPPHSHTSSEPWRAWSEEYARVLQACRKEIFSPRVIQEHDTSMKQRELITKYNMP